MQLIVLINTIKKFSPEVYKESADFLDRIMPIYNNEGEIIDAPPLQQSTDKSGIKLQWNGTNDSLYDLFAQLSLQTINSSTPLLGNTIENLARFLSENIEDMPSHETIERRIRTFREPNGERPKRNRIEIDILKGIS